MKRTLLSRLSSKLCLAVCSLSAVVSVHASLQYFSGATTAINWDNGLTADWGNTTGGPYTTTWVNGNDAVFQGTAATVTNFGVSARSITFSVANYVINSNTITFTGATPDVTNTVAANIGASIAGTAGFTKVGSGTLTLSGSNTFTGPLTNFAGSAVTGILVANNNALSSTTVVVGAGGGGGNTLSVANGIVLPSQDTLYLQCTAGGRAALANAGAVTFGGNIFASSADASTAPQIYANSGTGPLNLMGNIMANNLVQGVLLRGGNAGNIYGNVWVTNTPVFVADSPTWTIYSNSNLWNYIQVNGGKLKLGTNDALCTTGSLSLGQGNANAFSFDLSGFNQQVAVVTNNIGSVVNLFTNSSLNPSVFTVNSTAANSRIAPSGAGNIIVGGLISLVKNGPFQLALGAANTYTGTNTLNAGTLLITNSGTLGNTANPLFINGGTLNLGNTSQTVASLTLAAGTVTNGTLTSGSFAVQSGTNYAVLAGSGTTLTKTGNGTFLLAGANTYNGATTVTGGKVIEVTGGSCASAFTFSPDVGVATTNTVLINSVGGQWTCGGLTASAGSGSLYAEFNYGSVSSPSTTTAPLLINGTTTISGTLNITVTGGIGWASGVTYPLAQFVGTAPASITLNLVATPNGVLGGTLNYDPVAQVISYTAGSAPRSLAWDTTSGIWDINTTTNWLDANSNLTKFQQLDLATFNDAPGAGNFVITNNSAVTPSSLTFSNNLANYVITGSGFITGNGALTKVGTGSLTLATANTYSGGTVVSNGTLVLANSAALGSAALTIQAGSLDSGVANLVNANNNPIVLQTNLVFLGSQNLNLGSGIITFTTNTTFAVSNNTLTVSGSLSASSPTVTLTKSGPGTLQQGAANALGGVSLTINQGAVDLNGAALGVTAFNGTTNAIVLNNAGSGQTTLTIGNNAGGGTWNGTIADNSTGTGTIAVAKVGAGTVVFASSNSYSGPTTISSGIGSGCLFTVSHPNALGNTNGQVTEVDNNNCVLLNNNITVLGKTISIWGTGGSPSTGNGNGSLQGNAGQTNQWAGIVRLGSGTTPGRVGVRVNGSTPGLLVLSGSLQDGVGTSGAGLGLVVNCDTAGSAVLVTAPAGVNTYSASTTIGRGTLLLGATNTLPTNTVLNVGSAGTLSAVFDLNGFDQTVAGLTQSGANSSTIQNSGLTTNTLTIDQSTTTTYPGNIGGSQVNLVMNGPGQLTLTGTLGGDTGSTTVSNGTLLFDTFSGTAGPVTVTSGGTLGGTGNMSGPVTVNSGGTLAPGTNYVGSLAIYNDLTLAPGSFTVVEVNQSTETAVSQVTGLGTVTYGGTLLVTNVAGTLTTNDVFTVFSASTHVGNFTSIVGSPGTGLAWSFTNGVLSVVSSQTYASYPTNITASLSGNTLSISWPATHLGWILQAQTNSAAVGLTTNNWYDVIGSGSSNTNVINVNTSNPTVFYRLRMP